MLDTYITHLQINEVIGNNMETACKKINKANYYLLYITQLAKDKITASPVSTRDINCFNQWENILENKNLIWLKSEEDKTHIIVNSEKKKQLKNNTHIITCLHQKNTPQTTKKTKNNLGNTDIEFEFFENRIIEMSENEEKSTDEFYKKFLDENINIFKEKTTNTIQEQKK